MVRIGSMVVILGVFLAACSPPLAPTQPPYGMRDQNTGRYPPGLISFCYSSALNSSEEVRTYALEQCGNDASRLRFLGQDSFWTGCPLSQPIRVTYQCSAR